MRKYIYADEAGNFDFSNKPGASRYFILTTVLIENHRIEADLLDLRRDLVWENHNLPGPFHATTDQQVVRDRVFELLSKHDFRVDATIFEKRKVLPRVTLEEEAFYRYAWFYHMIYVARRVVTALDELMVIASSIGTRRKLRNFRYAVQEVVNQASPTGSIRVDMWPAAVEPCLQVADYCCWAIQRKWERGDDRSYGLIRPKIRSEYDLLAPEGTVYY